MNVIYKLEGLTVEKGGRCVLQVPALELREGESCAVTGPNGSGKSTLLTLLAMLEEPAAGRLIFCGEEVRWTGSSLRRFRREVTLLHQSPYLFAGSVERNIAWPLRLRGIRGAEAVCRIEEALETVGLSGFSARSARQLSGGEQRRVALARAMALQPRVLLLDEPTANLDPSSAWAFEEALGVMRRKRVTVIFSTHDRECAARTADAVLRLNEGRLSEPFDATGAPQTDTGRWQYACEF